jgi:hypothetical protein
VWNWGLQKGCGDKGGSETADKLFRSRSSSVTKKNWAINLQEGKKLPRGLHQADWLRSRYKGEWTCVWCTRVAKTASRKKKKNFFFSHFTPTYILSL